MVSLMSSKAAKDGSRKRMNTIRPSHAALKVWEMDQDRRRGLGVIERRRKVVQGLGIGKVRDREKREYGASGT